MPDIAHLLVSNSTQLDNVDLMGGPRDFTITDVALTGSDDQPLSITLAEYPRPWKPGLTMRRLLAHIWDSTNTDAYIGRRVRLHRDEKVSFGTSKTGGTRISHASHLDKKTTVTLPTAKGRFAEYTVLPLPDAPAPTQQPPEPTAEQVAACNDVDKLRSWWSASSPEMQATIRARVDELNAQAPEGEA